MDENEILEALAEDFFRGWDVTPTGGGFLIATDWVLPNNERIEIHVRRVGDREDLFIVTDGGELINYLFSEGVDLTRDRDSRRILDVIAENRSIKVTEHQLVKGAKEEEIPERCAFCSKPLRRPHSHCGTKLNQSRKTRYINGSWRLESRPQLYSPKADSSCRLDCPGRGGFAFQENDPERRQNQ